MPLLKTIKVIQIFKCNLEILVFSKTWWHMFSWDCVLFHFINITFLLAVKGVILK